ncbi:MAG: RNA-binding protein [Desulfobacterales bacterium]|nr:MAG: RNA-binding protein [Desulfobacterales bacterium]
MSREKLDFYGREVAGAIRDACKHFGVAQERLEIDVIKTGSTGIFGLIKKKAHIKAALKANEDEQTGGFNVDDIIGTPEKKKNVDTIEKARAVQGKRSRPVKTAAEPAQDQGGTFHSAPEEEKGEAEPENVELIKNEILQLVELMGFPSTVDVEVSGLSVSCILRGEYEEELVGPEGKVLDSLQYIVRKIISRKIEQRIRISLDVGDFRARRLEEMKLKALELAQLVKADGKTQALPPLNPSERREIHVVLQEDKEIRSRSVGDGLFKKILIYQPGKGGRGGRRHSGSRGRGNRSGRKQNQKNNNNKES